MGRSGGQRLRRRAGVQRRGHLRARERQDPARHPLLRRADRAARVANFPERRQREVRRMNQPVEKAVADPIGTPRMA